MPQPAPDETLAYRALALQTGCRAVNHCADLASARARMSEAIERIGRQVRAAKGFLGADLRLVVLPEYFLQGVTTPGKGEDGLKEFMKKAITIPGPEIEILGKKAKQYGMYIAGGGVVERLPEFPDRWFNRAFIVGPDGDGS